MNSKISETPAATSVPEKRRLASLLPCLLAFTMLALLLQWREGAFQSEFGGHPDEAAHYVTGLLVRDTLVFAKDLVASGMHGSPIAAGKEFVLSYYNHYPKIGLGVWPPFFYMVQSAWTLPFGPSRASVLILLAVLAGLTATLLFSAIREEHGPAPAFFGALAWLGLPLVQQYYGMAMAETLSTLLMFGAALRLGSYLDARRPRDIYAFGLLAAGAILTKGTGMALALVPLFAIAATLRFDILKEKALWIGAGIVVLLAGPWTAATYKQGAGAGGWEEAHPSLHFTMNALPYYGWKICVILGLLLGTLAVVGMAIRIAGLFNSKQNHQGKWAVLLGYILSVVLFQSIIPAGREARHLIPVVPALVMFAVEGAVWLAGRIPLRCFGVFPARARAVVCAAILALLVAAPFLGTFQPPFYGSIGDVVRLSPFGIVQKPRGGFAPVVETLMALSDKQKHGGVFLVSSDSSGEGMFISEVAMREKSRPAHFAKRASKELASSTWSGGGYKPKFDSDSALLAWLSANAVDFIVLDTAIPERGRQPHHAMLQRVVQTHREQFEEVASAPLSRGGDAPCGKALAYRIHHS